MRGKVSLVHHTLYMQEVLALSVLQTGVAFLATAGTAVVMAAPAQMLVTKFGPKLVTLIGLSLLTAGALWYTQIDVDGSYRSVAGLPDGRRGDSLLLGGSG